MATEQAGGNRFDLWHEAMWRSGMMPHKHIPEQCPACEVERLLAQRAEMVTAIAAANAEKERLAEQVEHCVDEYNAAVHDGRTALARAQAAEGREVKLRAALDEIASGGCDLWVVVKQFCPPGALCRTCIANKARHLAAHPERAGVAG